MKERYESFTGLIAKIGRYIKRVKSEEMAEYDLKGPHVSCHYQLYNRGPLTAKQLSDLCDEDKAAISRSIEYLEEHGYILSDSTVKKRDKSRLTLTEEGMRVGAVLTEKINSILDVASSGITDEERAVMYKCLMTISDNLKKICDEYGEQ